MIVQLWDIWWRHAETFAIDKWTPSRGSEKGISRNKCKSCYVTWWDILLIEEVDEDAEREKLLGYYKLLQMTRELSET